MYVFLVSDEEGGGYDIILIAGFIILMVMLVLGVLGWCLWRNWMKRRFDNQVSLRYPSVFTILFRK